MSKLIDTLLDAAGDIVFTRGDVEIGRVDAAGAITTKGSVNGGSPPLVRGNRVWGIGDSLTTGRGTGTQGTDGQPFFGPKQYIAWADMIANGRLYVENWAATTNFTAAQVLATHLPTVIAAKPAACLVLAGTNDIINQGSGSGPIPAGTIANLESIYTQFVAAGVVPIPVTLPPLNGYTKPVQLLNAWIKRNAYVNGYPCVDIYSVLANSSTSNYATGLDDGDGIHMSPQGAQVAGQAVSDQLATWLPPFKPWIACSNADTSGIANPLMLTDTNADGVPDNFAIDGFSAGVGVLATDAAVAGNAWTVTRAGTNLTVRNNAAITAAAGDKVALGIRFTTSGLTAAGTGVLHVGIQAGDNSNVTRKMASWGRDLPGWQTIYLEGTIPAGKTNAYAWIVLNTANFTIKVAQFTLLNLTANGLLA